MYFFFGIDNVSICKIHIVKFCILTSTQTLKSHVTFMKNAKVIYVVMNVIDGFQNIKNKF